MTKREEMGIEVLTVRGWYQGTISLPAGGRLLDYLNTRPPMISLNNVVLPGGEALPFLGMNTEQVLAIRPHAKA